MCRACLQIRLFPNSKYSFSATYTNYVWWISFSLRNTRRVRSLTLRDGIENREEKLAAVHATNPHAVSVACFRIHSRSFVRSFVRSLPSFPWYDGFSAVKRALMTRWKMIKSVISTLRNICSPKLVRLTTISKEHAVRKRSV